MSTKQTRTLQCSVAIEGWRFWVLCSAADQQQQQQPQQICGAERWGGKTLRYLLAQKIKISGPFSADTIFLKDNRKKFDVIVGMYHDQVLSPMKTIFGFEAINITIGLPFVRITPDHGPNFEMFGMNKSKPDSLIQAFSFIKKYVD